jgi:diaminopimelate decarboxylase
VGRFGISYENGDIKKAIELLKKAAIPVKGLHMHTSSSSRSLKIFNSLANKAVDIMEEYNLNELRYIDMGGGYFGGNFFTGKPTVAQYAQTICETLKNRLHNPEQVELILEPGAAILATSMDYLVSVLNIRDIRGHRIVTVDGSVIHINPMLHPHETPFTMINPGEETSETQIVGGSTCMEMDRFYPRDLSRKINHDSKLLFHCCGAYMSTHNSSFINAAPNIYIKKNDEYQILRKKNVLSMMEY